MEPIDFPEANTTLVADECNDLPAHRDKSGYVTCWKLTGDELVTVLQTGQVWLHLWGDAHPPVSLSVEEPFEEEKENGEGQTPA